MAEDDIGSMFGLGNLEGLGSDFVSIIVVGLIGLAIAGVAVFVYFYWKRGKKYDQKIWLWTIIDGEMRKLNEKPILAKFVSEGLTGDKTFEVKASKFNPSKVLKSPRYRVGMNEWYYFVTEENAEWINFRLKNMDKQLKEAGMHYSHEDMRLARVAIGRFLQFRLGKKESLLSKLLQMAQQWIPYIIIIIGLIMIIDKMMEFQSANVATGKIQSEIMDKILAYESGGKSGLIPAPPSVPPPP